MYHRVAELACDPWQLSVSPVHFDEQMQVLRKYGRPIKMKEMGKTLKRFSFGKKKIAVTFDDGYADNFHNAKPILERYNVPATFFIVSGAINSREEFWWDELERIILTVKRLPEIFELSISGKIYSWQVAQGDREEQWRTLDYEKMMQNIPQNNARLSKIYLYCVLWQILSIMPFEERKKILRLISAWAGQSLTPRPNYLPMTSKELISLANSKLLEIGAHTICHPKLSRLPREQQEKEIGQSKCDLENMIGRTITSFSYPYGIYSEDTVKFVEHLKFTNACTTVEKPVVRGMNPFLLPRFTVLNWNGDQFEENLRKWLTPEL